MILFFSLIGIIGIFLAKGANPPFGHIYLWMFSHVPGFIMFRDPTKWYTLIALSYAVLIPYTLYHIGSFLQGRFQPYHFKFLTVQNGFLLGVTCLLLLLIRPAITGEVGGTLQPVVVPDEYVQYKNFLLQDKSFSRVLWVPTVERFTFYSDMHPAIGGTNFFVRYDPGGVVDALKEKHVKELLEISAVKYVVVPDDTQKEIFLKDRMYDESQYVRTVEELEKITWLKKTYTFGRIVVYELENPKDHVWSSNIETKVQTTYINPTKYEVMVENAHKGENIIFSERFDKHWVAEYNGNLINAEPYDKLFNSFRLPEDGKYTLTLYYQPQKLVKTGILISSISIIILCIVLLFLFITKKKV